MYAIVIAFIIYTTIIIEHNLKLKIIKIPT